MLSDNDRLISQNAKKFGVMNEVFMPAGAFTAKRPPTNSMDSRRYDSDIGELQGMTAEIYENLPDELHDQMEFSIPFRNLVSKFRNQASHRQSPFVAFQFLKQLNSNRRSIIHQLRSGTASEIFGYSIEFYRVQYNREELPVFRALMKFSTDNETYSKYPPLLFPDKKHRDMKKIFRSIELTKVCFKYCTYIYLILSRCLKQSFLVAHRSRATSHQRQRRTAKSGK